MIAICPRHAPPPARRGAPPPHAEGRPATAIHSPSAASSFSQPYPPMTGDVRRQSMIPIRIDRVSERRGSDSNWQITSAERGGPGAGTARPPSSVSIRVHLWFHSTIRRSASSRSSSETSRWSPASRVLDDRVMPRQFVAEDHRASGPLLPRLAEEFADVARGCGRSAARDSPLSAAARRDAATSRSASSLPVRDDEHIRPRQIFFARPKKPLVFQNQADHHIPHRKPHRGRRAARRRVQSTCHIARRPRPPARPRPESQTQSPCNYARPRTTPWSNAHQFRIARSAKRSNNSINSRSGCDTCSASTGEGFPFSSAAITSFMRLADLADLLQIETIVEAERIGALLKFLRGDFFSPIEERHRRFDRILADARTAQRLGDEVAVAHLDRHIRSAQPQFLEHPHRDRDHLGVRALRRVADHVHVPLNELAQAAALRALRAEVVGNAETTWSGSAANSPSPRTSARGWA